MLLLLVCQLAQAQQSQPMYSYFDRAVGLKYLGINNGPVHLDLFRTVDQSHRYLIADKYNPGDVIYDGQPYPNESLKYDIFKDVLVAKINDPNNTMGINLINRKTESFTIHQKKFVNLDLIVGKPVFVKGYYEAYRTNAKAALYIKYRKDQIEVLTNEGLFYKYQNANEFAMLYNGTFYKVNDPRDLGRIFPAHDNSIKDYAYVNRETENTDKVQFMKTMADYINNLLQNDKN